MPFSVADCSDRRNDDRAQADLGGSKIKLMPEGQNSRDVVTLFFLSQANMPPLRSPDPTAAASCRVQYLFLSLSGVLLRPLYFRCYRRSGVHCLLCRHPEFFHFLLEPVLKAQLCTYFDHLQFGRRHDREFGRRGRNTGEAGLGR